MTEGRPSGTVTAPRTPRRGGRERPTLARDSGRAIAGSVVSNASNVVVILLLARTLGGEAVGQYTIAFAVRALLLLICGLGMRTTLTRFVANYLAREENGTVRGSVRAGLLVPMLVAMAGAAGWFALSGPLARGAFEQPDLAPTMQLFALSLPFFVFTDNALAATQGFQTMRSYVWVGQILDPLLRVSLTVAVLVAGGGVAGAALALLASSVVSALAAAVALARLLGTLPGSPAHVPWRELVGFGSLSWVASMATQGLLWADVIILGVLATAEEVGSYQVAARVVMIAMFVITPLTASMAPRIAYAWAHDDRDLVARRYDAVVLWSSRLSFPVLAGLVAVPSAVLFVFGDDFEGATAVIWVLAVGALAEAVGAPSSVLLNQIGRNRLNMVLNVSALALNIGLNFALIPLLGIEGAALAWSVTLVLGAVARIVAVRRVATGRWPFGRRMAAAAGGGAAAAVVASVAAAPLESVPLLQLLVAAVLVVGVYLAVQLLVGLDVEEHDTVSRAVSRRFPALRTWVVAWRQRGAGRSTESIALDELISPFRFDVLARADLFRLARANRRLVGEEPAAFVALARCGRYGEWFDQVLVARGHVPRERGPAQDRVFAAIVDASLQLMERHDRLGREALGRVSVARVSAGTDLGGWRLGEDRWVLVDGGHRVALAVLDGQTTLQPGDYVVETGATPPNNTAALLDGGSLAVPEALGFLARGLVTEERRDEVRTWSDLLDLLAEPANREVMAGWPQAPTLAEADRAADPG